MNCLLWALSIRVSSFHGNIQAIRVLMRQKICDSNNVMSLTTFQNNYVTNAGMHLTICLNSWLCCWTAAAFLSKVRCKTTLKIFWIWVISCTISTIVWKVLIWCFCFFHIAFCCLKILIHIHKLFKWALIHYSFSILKYHLKLHNIFEMEGKLDSVT